MITGDPHAARNGQFAAESLAQFFAGKTVFLTGHTGFKGSWLALWLHRLGAEVIGYSLAPPTDPSNFVVSDVGGAMAEHIEADVRDRELVRSTIERVQPDIVFHLAAETVVRRSYRTPYETYDVNVMGTVAVLEAIRLAQLPCIAVVVTSDKCYENREQLWGYREDEPLGGSDPYSASKAATEMVVQSYQHSYFSESIDHGLVRLASARAGNVIGGGDWTEDALIPEIMAGLRDGRPISLRSPHATRPWQHVLVALSGYLRLAQALGEAKTNQHCSAWNFGPQSGDELPVRLVAEELARQWGTGDWEDGSKPEDPREAMTLKLSIEKSRSQLQWYPTWNIQQTLEMTAQWYRDFASGDGGRDICLRQIEHFEHDMSRFFVVEE